MKRILILTVAASIFITPAAFAAVSDEDFATLREQLAAVSARLDKLENENAQLRAAQDHADTAISQVQTLDGDFRYRHEYIDKEGSDSRTRTRIRARANIKAQVADNIQAGFGLATGGDDPVSTNQTLGGGGSSKGVVLNLAYVDWEATDSLHLIAGKFKNPLKRAGKQALTWDGDWTPEGLAVKYQRDWFFANAIGTYLEGDSKKSNRNFSWGGQVGASGMIGDMKVTGGLGYYSIPTKGRSTTFGDPTGTTPDADCVYLYDYDLMQVFGEASFDIGEFPALVFFDYVNNSDPSENDTGWTVGTRIGQAKDRGEMQFTYFYADKEADSMLGLLTDSDFGGGGTDSRGHWLQVNYGVSNSWAIGAQYFINEIDIASGSKSDYNRLMIDMQWKWK